MSLKPVHLTRTVNRWLLRHRSISSEWIVSVVLWTEKKENKDEFIIQKIIKLNRQRKIVTLWIKDYSWRYLVYKIHMEKYK